MDILDQIFSLDLDAIHEPPATKEQLARLRAALGELTPPLLEALLAKSNGGEFSFCRFEPSPFLPSAEKDVWDHVASHYPPSDLIDRREFLPLGNDYGDGLYCLNLRHDPARVTFVPYWAQSEDEFSLVGDDFEDFLKKALDELHKASHLKKTTVCVALAPNSILHTPELAELGVRLRFIDRALVTEFERSSSFPNADLIALYEDETRSLFYTLEPLNGDSREFDYGIVNPINQLRALQSRVVAADGAEHSNGGGFQYLTDKKTRRRYPVWSVTLSRPLQRGSHLEMEFEYYS